MEQELGTCLCEKRHSTSSQPEQQQQFTVQQLCWIVVTTLSLVQVWMAQPLLWSQLLSLRGTGQDKPHSTWQPWVAVEAASLL